MWLAHPGTPPLTLPAPWLSDAEQAIAASAGPARQREFLHSRWLLRQALAQVSGQAAVRCQPVPGRPTASLMPPGWHLSLSHCRQLAACATGMQEVGVDIEPLSRRSHWQGIVRRWFTPREQDWLLAAPPEHAHQQFLTVWTLKEAWLKATGRGIANNLQTLEVAADLQLRGDAASAGWHAAVGTAAGFMIALVYRAEAPHTPRCAWLEPPADTSAVEVMPTSAARDAAVSWLITTSIATEAR
ncbi:4'-phosphopantetheinyl transferase family protein [Marinobacter sp. X15-166B]|uniref:4'-phosphopantetheinyl transferase family protein n=1 Tax=Marinobacter sp. X15-166B TaxID=1897620 RepID=UPI001D1796D8|nr:4'-phosphopantetheinyl transferase superfamily protein [Marinobacter sp. X15-166B]